MEAIVALVVLAIFLVGVMRAFTASVLLSKKGEYLRLAASSAQEAIEKARVTAFDQIIAANFPSPFDIKATDNPNRVVGRGEITIEPYPPDNPQPKAKQVIVSTRVGSTRGTTA